MYQSIYIYIYLLFNIPFFIIHYQFPFLIKHTTNINCIPRSHCHFTSIPRKDSIFQSKECIRTAVMIVSSIATITTKKHSLWSRFCHVSRPRFHCCCSIRKVCCACLSDRNALFGYGYAVFCCFFIVDVDVDPCGDGERMRFGTNVFSGIAIITSLNWNRKSSA